MWPHLPQDVPLTDLLAFFGLAHERDGGTKRDRRHRLFNPQTGEDMGRFSAHEAADLLDEFFAQTGREG